MTFQLTTSQGGRLQEGLGLGSLVIFQLTTSQGGRRRKRPANLREQVFQLTTSQGGRPSISSGSGICRGLSTHDLTRRSTLCCKRGISSKCLSTHDLTRRSTCSVLSSFPQFRPFNSRPHKEVDIYSGMNARETLTFQLTTSQGGRLYLLQP